MLFRALLILLCAVFLVSAAAAQPPNLTYYYHPNFSYPLTPTSTISGTIPVVLPTQLQGNSATTYLSYAELNNGGAYSGTGLIMEYLFLDGEYIVSTLTPYLNQGDLNLAYDLGPFNVRGGRHTLGFRADYFDELAEGDETDNVWGHQFVFTSYVLSEATPKTRGVPPDGFGGITDIVDGSLVYQNCDGFRFTSTGYWNAITLYAVDDQDDYDLEIFVPSTGSENGFVGGLDFSANLAGFLDVVFVNRNTVGVGSYDVGVQKYEGTSHFVIEQVVSTSASVGSSLSVNLGINEYLRIWDTYIGDTGWVTVKVDDLSPNREDIRVGWIEHDATILGHQDISEWAVTDESGKARLHRNFTATGWYGLVVYRDPRDGGEPKPLTVSIEPTSPDFTPHYEPGWVPPLVPTPSPISSKPTALPDTLHGFMPQTYLNFTVANLSHVWTPAVEVEITQDGMPGAIPFSFLGFAPMVYIEEFDLLGRYFPGGRHTLILDIDPANDIYEFNEDNNFHGEQYCWSPLELGLGWQYGHPAPGPAVGGFGSLDPMSPIFPNCDGYRLYTGYSEWEGMVLTQGANSDYDLVIHHALNGVKEGFDDDLADSPFWEGYTDYVLFNNQLLPAVAHDIGVENYLGDEPYTIEAVGSTNLPTPVGGHYGPYTMPISNMLHLYNLYLVPDVYAFRLDNLAAPVDWGFALHPHDMSYQGRHQTLIDGAAYLAGPGDPEWFTVNIPAAGYYGLAVFKATPFGFDQEGEYNLTILQGVSDVTDDPRLPAATALAGIYPNPFNPQTTISYDLAIASTVTLDIYDVKGALVRRLVQEPMPAGRHTAVWDGQDDGGSRAASGVYLAKFSAGGISDAQKVVMVK